MKSANRIHSVLHINYLIAMAFLMISMPIFNVGMSIGTILLVANWLFDLFIQVLRKEKPIALFQNLKKNKAALWLMSIYAVHLLGMLYTSDIGYGLHDLRVKLPLLLIPLVLSNVSFSDKECFWGLHLFILALLFSTLTNLFVLYGWTEVSYSETREIPTRFITRISHIRLSLLVSFGIAFLSSALFKHKKLQIYHLLIILYLFFFLWQMEMMTGIIVSFLVIVGWSVLWIVRRPASSSKIWLLTTLVVLLCAPCLYVGHRAIIYFDYSDAEISQLDTHSALGAKYAHHPELKQLENGHRVWINIAWKELKNSWNERSKLPFEGLDERGQKLSTTLIRYLSSKGLRKDAEGLAQLNEEDIALIEKGVSNTRIESEQGINRRLDELFFEVNAYRDGENPSGHSIAQRFEFWTAATYIFSNAPLIGVGTGDIQKAFTTAYDDIHSALSTQYRLRTHNQYLTFLATFGIIGFSFMCFALYKSIRWRQKTGISTLFYFFLFIMLLSFTMEDTLETQAGSTMFAVFSALFLVVGMKTKQGENLKG